jgi:hypothetical protein
VPGYGEGTEENQMIDLPTIRAVRIGSPSNPWFKPYVYGGNEPFTPPTNQSTMDRPCSADGCAGSIHAKGMCDVHYRRSLKDDIDADARRRSFDPANCGTRRGYRHHLYHRVEVCRPCRDAKNKYERQTYAQRMGAGK